MTPRALALAGVVAGLLILAASAPAGAVTAYVDGDTLYIEGTDDGENFGVENGYPGWWNVRSSSPIEAGSGCEIFNDSAVLRLRCPSAGITAIDADAGPGNDVFTIQTNLTPMPGFMTAVMGDGDDNITDPRTSGDSGFGMGAGNDRVLVHHQRVGVLDIDAGPGNDDLGGGQDGDVLRGGDGDDIIRGEAGNDRIDAGDGHDEVIAAAGDDTVDGGTGDDALGGGAGNDTVTGGAGEDRVGSDHYPYILTDPFNAFTLENPQGHDTLYLRDGEPDEVRCGGGVDTADIDNNVDYEAEKEAPNCETYTGDDGGGGGGTPPPSGGGGTPPPSGGGGVTPTPPPGPSALLVSDTTTAVQSIRAVLRKGVTASLTTNAPGTWKLRLLAGKKVLGSKVKQVTGAGAQSTQVKLNAAGRKRLRRARTVKLTLGSTFTDTQGRRMSTKRKLTLKRSVPKPPASAAVQAGLYDCYSFSLSIGNTTYQGSVILEAGGGYAHAAGRSGRDLIDPREGTYSQSDGRITFASGPLSALYGVPTAATKFDVWAKGEQVKSWTCSLKP